MRALVPFDTAKAARKRRAKRRAEARSKALGLETRCKTLGKVEYHWEYGLKPVFLAVLSTIVDFRKEKGIYSYGEVIVKKSAFLQFM